MSAAPRVRFAGRRLAPVPVQRIAHVRGIRGGRTVLHCSPVRLRPAAKILAVQDGFLTRTGRNKLVSKLLIGVLLAVWAVLMAFAGRDGIKPQDPSAAANVIRK